MAKVKTALFSSEEIEKYRLKRGDLLICEGGEVGRAAVWERDDEMYYQNALHRVRFYGGISPYYFCAFMEYCAGAGIIDQYSKGQTIKHLVQSSLVSLCIPLPPLAEQKRIVAKIEDLMPLVEEYGKAEERLSALDASFPDTLRKSILQRAIQGKLTKRDPADEPASELLKRIHAEKAKLVKEGKIKKEKPLPPITEDEIPFEIPESWKWARLGDISESVNVGIVIRPTRYYVPQDEGTPAFRNCNIQQGFIDDGEWVYLNPSAARENPRSVVKSGDILIARSGTPGNCCVVPEAYNGRGAVDIVIVRLHPELADSHYIKTCVCAPTIQKAFFAMSRGVTLSHLGATAVASQFVPLPPLAEQKRIVAKLEELLPLCDALK